MAFLQTVLGLSAGISSNERSQVEPLEQDQSDIIGLSEVVVLKIHSVNVVGHEAPEAVALIEGFVFVHGLDIDRKKDLN